MGGRPGATSCFWRNQGSNGAVDLGNTDVVPLDPGDVILVTSSGGGGFGPPAERDAKAVLFDVQQGKVSIQAAADDYGVVIRDGAIDETATAARRARLAANAKPGIFAFNAEREAYEREWTDANYAALTEVLATLPVNWRHYMKKRIFAAMAELPAHQRRGDGSEVRRAFELAKAEFPQLRQAQAAE
jgi:N-methylhydantoinase B